MERTKIVVIGGGTGTFTVLSGLKKFRKINNLELSAVVSMADDGGSTGVLRDELGVLPPGDIRQCLVALSTSDALMRSLMNYRFESGVLRGHNFGNLLLSALEKVTGGFDQAIEKVSEILRCEGKVIPVTLDKVSLVANLRDGKKIIGQKNIFNSDLKNLQSLTLSPKGKANKSAARAILEADAVVVGPGDFYTSLVPNLLVDGIASALCRTRAKKIYICNLMTKLGHTDGFLVDDFLKKIEKFAGTRFDAIIYNNKRPPNDLIEKYAREGEHVVSVSLPKSAKLKKILAIGSDILNKKIQKPKKGDPLSRNLIRHAPARLAELILKVINRP